MLDAIVKIIVGLFALIGVCLTGWLGWKQFSIKRNDEKEEKGTQLMIDQSIKAARIEITNEIKEAVQQGIIDCGVIGDKAIRATQEELLQQFEEGLKARSEEGAQRFNIHAESLKEVNRLIAENSKQISDLTVLTKDVLTNMDSINKVVTISAESQKNNNYDRLLIVTNKILKSHKMTIEDKTNLKQLYKSWKDLKGNDPKMDTMYDECIKLEIELEDDDPND